MAKIIMNFLSISTIVLLHPRFFVAYIYKIRRFFWGRETGKQENAPYQG